MSKNTESNFNKNFVKEDREVLSNFLNFIIQKAEFNKWKSSDTITHFKLLAYIEQILLPKIEANIVDTKD